DQGAATKAKFGGRNRSFSPVARGDDIRCPAGAIFLDQRHPNGTRRFPDCPQPDMQHIGMPGAWTALGNERPHVERGRVPLRTVRTEVRKLQPQRRRITGLRGKDTEERGPILLARSHERQLGSVALRVEKTNGSLDGRDSVRPKTRSAKRPDSW